MPGVHPGLVRNAFMAHALAVIEAFSTDRVEDRQTPGSPDLVELLQHVREARDRAIGRVFPGSTDPELDYANSEAQVLGAIAAERELMQAAEPVDFARYEAIVLAKTSVGNPASLALARAAGWDRRRCAGVRDALQSTWLGMQYQDDVVDWEDDIRRGNAWPLLLARKVRSDAPLRDRPTERNPIQKMLFSCGILTDMLARGHRHFRAARMRATALQCPELAGWARAKEVHAGRSSGRRRAAPDMRFACTLSLRGQLKSWRDAT